MLADVGEGGRLDGVSGSGLTSDGFAEGTGAMDGEEGAGGVGGGKDVAVEVGQ